MIRRLDLGADGVLVTGIPGPLAYALASEALGTLDMPTLTQHVQRLDGKRPDQVSAMMASSVSPSRNTSGERGKKNQATGYVTVTYPFRSYKAVT